MSFEIGEIVRAYDWELSTRLKLYPEDEMDWERAMVLARVEAIEGNFVDVRFLETQRPASYSAEGIRKLSPLEALVAE